MRIASPAKKIVVVLLIALGAWAGPVSGYAQQELLPVHLTIVSVSPSKLVVWVAANEGLFKKNGLDVQHFIPPSSAEGFKKLTGIDVPAQYVRETPASPVTIGGGTPGIVRRGADAKAKKRLIVLSADNMAKWPIFARKDITKPEQLKGKRIGHSENIGHFHALLFLEKMGWDPTRDVTLVPSQQLDGLETGAIDAFVDDEVVSFVATSRGYKPLVDIEAWKVPMTITGITVDEDWLQEHRETTRRLVKAYVEAIALMKNNKQVAVRAMVKYWNVTDPKMQDWFYDRGVALIARKPYPSVEGVKKTMQLYDSEQMRKYKPEDFYDASFVRELDQSGFIDGLYKGSTH